MSELVTSKTEVGGRLLARMPWMWRGNDSKQHKKLKHVLVPTVVKLSKWIERLLTNLNYEHQLTVP